MTLTRNKKPQKLREYFLIVTEGIKTEPHYFKSFNDSQKIHLDIEGSGMNTDSLVEYAIKKRKENENLDSFRYNRSWVVFDKDSFMAQNFHRALSLAKNNNFYIAYSNQCFEIWYLLHFEYYTSDLDRAGYAKLLTNHLGFEYKKNSMEMYGLLKDKQANAIRNAKKLRCQYDSDTPFYNSPSTSVYELVEQLNEINAVDI